MTSLGVEKKGVITGIVEEVSGQGDFATGTLGSGSGGNGGQEG